MAKIVHFDIYADDPARASKFYSEALGWKFKKWEGEGSEGGGMEYWLITTGSDSEKGINGGMARREEKWASQQASLGAVTVGVSDIDLAIEKIKKSGGEIMMEKMKIPGVGWFTNFKDPEGNILSLMQEDMSIK